MNAQAYQQGSDPQSMHINSSESLVGNQLNSNLREICLNASLYISSRGKKDKQRSLPLMKVILLRGSSHRTKRCNTSKSALLVAHTALLNFYLLNTTSISPQIPIDCDFVECTALPQRSVPTFAIPEKNYFL